MRGIWTGLAVAAGLAGAAQAAPLEAYGKLPTIQADQFALSPAGDRLAFVAGAGAARQLVVRELTGKTLMAVAISKNKIRYLRWAGEGHVLLGTSSAWKDVDSDSAGYEIGQVVVISPDTHKSFAVFQQQGLKIWPEVRGDYGAFEVGGKWYGFFGGVTMSGGGNSVGDFANESAKSQTAYLPDHWWTDVYRVNLDTGIHEKISGGALRLSGRALGPGGEIVAHTDYDERTGKWALYAGAGGDHKVAEQNSPLHDIGLQGLGRGPGTVTVWSTASENSGLYEFDLAHGDAQTQLLRGEVIEGYRQDRNNYLVAAVVERDRPVTVFLDPKLQDAFARAAKPFGKLNVSYVAADDSWTKWILLTSGDGDSGSYYLVDLNKGSAEMIATMYPDIDTPDVGSVRMVEYKAADGLALKGVLTTPPGKEAKNLPVVILPHGGPEDHDTLGFNWLAQAFASQGYAVFQPNFRGSDGSTVALRDAGHGEWGRKMQTDLSDGLAELARQGVVDPKRACIVGASYGGYAALAGVTVQHGLYRCAVSYAGPADLNNMLRWETDRHGQQSSTFRYWKIYMGAKSEGDGSLREISPTALAAKADAPVLLIHGKTDTVVPIEQSRMMAGALRGAGKPVELIELDGEDHWLSGEATRVQMLKAAVEFVKKHNPPA